MHLHTSFTFKESLLVLKQYFYNRKAYLKACKAFPSKYMFNICTELKNQKSLRNKILARKVLLHPCQRL